MGHFNTLAKSNDIAQQEANRVFTQVNEAQ
jgi:hypothetical protein